MAVAAAEQVSMLGPTRATNQGGRTFCLCAKRRFVGPLRWPAQPVCKGLPPRPEVSGLALSPPQPESTAVTKKAYCVAPLCVVLVVLKFSFGVLAFDRTAARRV